MKKKIIFAAVIAAILLSFVLSFFLFDMQAFYIFLANSSLESAKESGSEERLQYAIKNKNQKIRDLVFLIVLEVSFIAVSVTALFFISRGEIASEASNAARYTYEGYRAHREAKRAERQEKKRKRLEEKLDRMSRGHES